MDKDNEGILNIPRVRWTPCCNNAFLELEITEWQEVTEWRTWAMTSMFCLVTKCENFDLRLTNVTLDQWLK